MMIAMAALLCSAPISILRYTEEWECFRWIASAIFLIFVCKFVTGEDRIGEIPFVQPLLTLLVCWISFSLKNNQVEEPAEYPKTRSQSIKDSTEQSTVPKKRQRKDKKKKKKAMDSKGSPKFEHRKGRRIYSPLKKYLQLDMDAPRLYNEFSSFILNESQLIENDYPRDSPENPGRFLPRYSLHREETVRQCARCESKFEIVAKREYRSNTTCSYHPSKRPDYETGKYVCCDGAFNAKGCAETKHHVSAEQCLEDVVFKRVRGKRQVRRGQTHSVYALDCEMSYTTAGLEVTKVGVVSADGLTVYETFVQPEHQVLCLNTAYSGVTADDLKGTTTTLSDVQAFLLQLLNKESILVGHALANDLKALRIIHEKIVDTSVTFPHPSGGKYRRPSLRCLAKDILNKIIQDGDDGHDCIEDARTCVELMLYKIGSKLEERLPVAQDENRNSFLQNSCPAPILPPNASYISERYMKPLCANEDGTYCFVPKYSEPWVQDTWRYHNIPMNITHHSKGFVPSMFSRTGYLLTH